MSFYYKNPERLRGNRKAVRDLLSDGRWHTTMEFLAIAGANGTRRVRELREYGYVVETRPVAGPSDEWEYRIAGHVSEDER